MINILKRIFHSLMNSTQNYTPAIWFPLTIVCMNGIVHILNTQYLLAFVKYPNIPQNIQIAIQVFGGFSIIAGAFINWILITVIIFFWCELFYDVEGIFRHFFEIVGICHLVLLGTTLICSVFIFAILPENPNVLQSNTRNAQETVDVITETLAPLESVRIAGRICFGLILVPVVQSFFQIRWLKAFCSVGIPYTIYWILSRILQSVFQFN